MKTLSRRCKQTSLRSTGDKSICDSSRIIIVVGVSAMTHYSMNASLSFGFCTLYEDA